MTLNAFVQLDVIVEASFTVGRLVVVSWWLVAGCVCVSTLVRMRVRLTLPDVAENRCATP